MPTPYEFSKEVDVQKTLNSLRVNGIAVLRNYLELEDLSSLKEEFHKSFTSKDPGIYFVHDHLMNEQGKVARAQLNKLSKEEFPATKKIFSSDFFESLANSYFKPHKFVLNENIFFTHEKESEKAILPWHFDRDQSLKFYFYLKNTDQNNGAFEYDLGSHREGHYRANYYLLKGIPMHKIPNDIPEEELHNPKIIDGKAGDLIIFDPDGFHRGGFVKPGQERMVVRGHTHPRPEVNKMRFPFRGWWLQTPLNFSKLWGSLVERKLNKEYLSGAYRERGEASKEIRDN